MVENRKSVDLNQPLEIQSLCIFLTETEKFAWFLQRYFTKASRMCVHLFQRAIHQQQM